MIKKKYLIVCILTLIFFSILLYKNYFYYQMSYNPIARQSSELSDSTYTEYNPDYSSFYNKQGSKLSGVTRSKTTNTSIYEYISGLELKPSKEEKSHYIIKGEYLLGFNSPVKHDIVINIFSDDLSIIQILSTRYGFREGYYKITNDTFDYEYINRLIENEERRN